MANEIWGIWATGRMGAAWAKTNKLDEFEGTEQEAREQADKWNKQLSGHSTVRYRAMLKGN